MKFIDKVISKPFNFKLPKVKQQLMLTFMLATVIPIFVIGMFSIMSARKQLREQYDMQIQAEAARINSTLFDITTSMHTSCEPIIMKELYRNLFSISSFSDVNRDAYDSLSDTLAAMHKSTAAISSIHIYTNNPNIPTDSYIMYDKNNYADQQWYPTMKNGIWNNWCGTTLQNKIGQISYELTLTRKIPTISNQYSAYMVITLSSNYLKNRLLYTDCFVMAAIDNAPSFFSSSYDWMNVKIPFPADFNGDYYKYTGVLTLDGQTVLTNIATFAPYKTDNKFYILVTDKNANHTINSITAHYGIILILALLLPAVLILLFTSYFSTRIISLREAMHQASIGDYNIINTFPGDDELAETFADLKTTVQLIHEKEAHFYQSQITRQQLVNKQQQMEFKMLASQINPHFLYNTLETIRMQALSNQNYDVAASIKLLGKSMHYVLENTGTDSTTLNKELEHIRVYLAIQKLRFDDRVNYSIHIDNNIHSERYKILPLLLQPIVENAVIHGLENIQEDGLVNISAFLSPPDMLSINITDNGEGMDEQTMRQLIEKLNSKSPDSTSGIGLYNINQRIKLFYGELYGLKIDANLPHGTSVTLILPQQHIED